MGNPWGITAAHVTSADWPDAGKLGTPVVESRLDAAQRQCEAYAPAVDVAAITAAGGTVPDDLPAGYLLAVVYQARDVHNAAQLVGDRAAVGEVYAVRVAPLSSAVKALLRPESARWVTG